MPSPYPGNDVFPASMNIPSDGDDDAAGTFNPAYEALADRTRYLKNRLAGVYFEADVAYAAIPDPGTFPSSLWTSSGVAGTFTLVTGTQFGPATAAVAGDLLIGAIQVLFFNPGGALAADFEIRVSENGGGYVANSASRQRISGPTPSNGYAPLRVPFTHLVLTSGVIAVQLFGATQTGGTGVQVSGNINSYATLLRGI